MEKPGILHLPCLAIAGKIISMSAPHPSKPREESPAQTGWKPGTWGKILPGWRIEKGRAFPGDLPLPGQATPDGEGFLTRP